jgi:hypothetical protein
MIILFTFSAISLASLMSSSIPVDYFSQQSYAQQQQTPPTTLTPPTASTQSNATANMKVYENSTYGIRIQYPSDWIYGEQNRTNIVTFIPSSSLNSILLNNIGSSLTNQTNTPPLVTIGFEFLPFHNIPLGTYNDITINSLKQSPGFQLATSSPANLAGNPAYMIQYSEGPLVTLAIYTIIGNQLYTVAYVVDSAEYSKYVPTIIMVYHLPLSISICERQY